ncbi:MAG: hypothetical protein ACREUG_02495 [Steroidobacteraceae bacterium]
MGRHGLYDGGDAEDVLEYGRWRGAVAATIRGRNGQAFLRELLAALDAIESQCLIGEALENEHGEVCALGAVGRARGLDLQAVDYEDYESVAKFFGISEKLAQEIMWINDKWTRRNNVPDKRLRYLTVRRWVLQNIKSRGALVSTEGKPVVTSTKGDL